MYRTKTGYRTALCGLVPPAWRRTFEEACTSLNCAVYRKSGLSPRVPTLSLTKVASMDQLRELQRRSGVERVFWLRDLSEVAIPISSLQVCHGAEPLHCEVYRLSYVNGRSFAQP